ncbi:MAG: PQQ-binding-like beta-propeller repeat protein [Planctomycetes bacterium]|nr:PQQ-binding-like beta-propeller repeat protein [Planctomycetota bacterium]
MSQEQAKSNDETTDSSVSVAHGHFKTLRIWPPLLLIAVTGVLWFIPRVFEDVPFALQLASMLGPALCGILVLLWWVLLSRATAKERFAGFLGVSVAFGLTLLFLDESMLMPGVLLVTIPMGMAAFALGTILFAKKLSFQRTLVAVLLAACGFGVSDLLRSEGMWGELAALELKWRWQSSHEDRMLAHWEGQQTHERTDLSSDDVDQWLANPEWPAFRGADRLSRQQGPPISADWSNSPPEQIWKIPVGPGWSSFAVAGKLLFTQEQRGPLEMIVCYAADSGREIWTQAVETRFSEALGGPGPRATPTLAGGNLFVLGANGNLMRLNPKNGDITWQTELQEVALRSPPEWGFSSSPLVVGANVIVHAGGKGDKGTLAFDVETGTLNWSAASGDHSYSSPQLSTIAGEDLVLMQTNTGLDLLNPQTGATRLFYPWDYDGYRVLQPQIVGDDSILLATGMGVGTRRIRISESNGKLAAEDLWTSRRLKPDFNDFVVHENHAYGFDGAIFTCIDLASGKRAWKGGRYGKGQVLLLTDSGLLLIASEHGEVVLLKTNTAERQEVAKFQAIEGKTWNHPVVVGDRLYIRNAQEAACYRLPLENGASLSLLDNKKR